MSDTKIAADLTEFFDDGDVRPMPVRIAHVWGHFREYSDAERVAFARQVLDGTGWRVVPPCTDA